MTRIDQAVGGTFRSGARASSAGFFAVAALSAASVCQTREIDRQLYPYEIPLGHAIKEPLNQDDAILLRVHSSQAAKLAARLEQTSVKIVRVSIDTLKLTLNGRDTLRADPTASDQAASFVIDYDETPVRDLLAQIPLVDGQLRSIDDLTDFVNRQMSPTPYARDFELASAVARTRIGDCSEYAILLTALARASGYPARTVLGSVIMGLGDDAGAYGHAWTEIFADGKWHLADSTLPVAGDRPVLYYLPVGTLESEGPGYLIGLVNVLTLLPQRFDKLRNVPLH